MKIRSTASSHSDRPSKWIAAGCSLALAALSSTAVHAAELLAASFNSGSLDGFSYQDDPFGTSQPSYATGSHAATGGYGGTGGLQVSLGGINATAISGMSGGWSSLLNLAAAETGVKLSFRYKLEQSATYEYDEYSRVLVKVNGTQYGRGSKNYVDHIGGDGSSSQGNSSTYLPTTDWQQAEIYLGDLSAGDHGLVIGGYNNKKDASDESTTLVIDDVLVTSGNAAPAITDAQTLVGRLDPNEFLGFIQGVAQFGDRCRGSGMNCSSTDYTSNYMAALTWVETQLQAMGYTPVRHTFSSNTGGTNLYATKMGSVTPTEMYMVSAHLDARSGGDGFDDDGSGVALVLEAARVFAGSDVTTDKSVRFIFWDKEETGLNGATAYASNTTSTGGRRALQGTTDEPTWLGLIQHDMVLYDHGAGTRTTAQSPYADLDVEWRAGTTQEAASRALALKWRFLNGEYSTDFPATAYNYSTNTDDTPFHPYVASVSVRENRRSLTSNGNAEWINPYYHTTNDVEDSYLRDDDGDGLRDDIELGFNAVQATVGLVAELAGVQIATSGNHPPEANPQSLGTAEDTSKAITLSGSDPDGDLLTFQVVTSPSHGSLSGTVPSLTYTPAADYNGPDSFTFRVNDGQVDSATVTVSISVTALNDPPVADAQSVTLTEDTSKAMILTGSDVDGNPLTYGVVTGPAHGSLSGAAPNLTYTPAANYNGPDSFTFRVNDGTVDSSPATVSLTVTALNDAPVANGQALSTPHNTPVAVTLTGSDVDGDPLTFLVTNPYYGSLSGTAPNLTYTPAAGFSGSDSFTFRVNDGKVSSTLATVALQVATATYSLPFVDDFETLKGWVANPAGTDSATSGRWERADPQGTSSSGPKQLGTTVSGTYDLVTGAAAGSDAGSYDLDGGVTSIRSPNITLPASGDITLALSYYLAHGNNASSDDYFRVKVVGASTATLLEVRGKKSDVDAVWKPFSASLNAFAGQTVYLLIEAADLGRASLVEAAVDDLSITATTSSGPLLSASFDTDAQGFSYQDDAFQVTAQPDYASGDWLAAGGHDGGALRVSLGGVDTEIVDGMSGGWSQTFTLPAEGAVTIAFWFNLTQSPDYEEDEISQALFSVDGVLYGYPPDDFLAQIIGNGNGGSLESTGWQLFSVDLGMLAEGAHTLTIGGYNSRKTYTNEITEVLIDDLVVSFEETEQPPSPTLPK